jgi:hypothetical protein
MEDTNKFIGSLERKGYRGSTDVIVFNKIVSDPRAKLAEEFVVKWGLVAAAPDGEDSAGRMKLRLLTVQELVNRACDTAAAITDEFDKRGWLVPLPFPKISDDEA